MKWPYRFPTQREELEDRLLGRPERTIDEALQYFFGLANFGSELRRSLGSDPEEEHPLFVRWENEGNERLIAWKRHCREKRRAGG